MGHIEIIRPDGSGFATSKGGELLAAQFMFCDKCEQLVNAENGKYIEAMGERVMWWCQDCR
jgi:hypothetical protein